MAIRVDQHGYPLPPKSEARARASVEVAIQQLIDAGHPEAAEPLYELLDTYPEPGQPDNVLPPVEVPPEEVPTEAPVNRDVPYVSPQDGVAPGEVLSCTMGNWDNVPSSYDYRWQTIDDPPDVLVGQMDKYAVPEEDVGKTIVCVVTARNIVGATDAPPSNAVQVNPA